jgi:preprotein translocase subunit SecA
MTAFRVEDLPIESKMLTNALDEAQRKVESYFFDIRRQLFEYDQVMNTQRDKVYGERRRALLASDLSKQMVEYAERTVDDILEANIDPSLPPAEWGLDGLAAKMKQYCYMLEDLTGDLLQQAGGDYEALRAYLRNRGVDAYRQKVQEVDAVEPGLMQDVQRFFVLTQTDNLWKEHLQAIKFLQQAVGLRGYAQRDPLVEYKLEGYNLFLEMMAQIRRNTIYNVYQFDPDMAARQKKIREVEAAQIQQQMTAEQQDQPSSSAEAIDTAAEEVSSNGHSNGSAADGTGSANGAEAETAANGVSSRTKGKGQRAESKARAKKSKR